MMGAESWKLQVTAVGPIGVLVTCLLTLLKYSVRGAEVDHHVDISVKSV